MVQKSFRGYVVRRQLAADGPPRFLGEGLQDVSLVDGSAAKIVGRVKGFPDPTIAWFKDGQPVKESRKFKIVFEDPDLVSLVVTNCDQADVGTYTCKAYNQFGEAFDSAKVIIEVPAKVEKDQPTVPSRSDPPSPSPPPSPETPNQRSAGPRTAKMSKKMTTLPTTSTVNPPPLPSPTSPRRMLVNTKC